MYVDVPPLLLSPLQWGDIVISFLLSGLWFFCPAYYKGPAMWLQQDCCEGMQRGVDNVLADIDPLNLVRIVEIRRIRRRPLCWLAESEH